MVSAELCFILCVHLIIQSDLSSYRRGYAAYLKPIRKTNTGYPTYGNEGNNHYAGNQPDLRQESSGAAKQTANGAIISDTFMVYLCDDKAVRQQDSDDEKKKEQKSDSARVYACVIQMASPPSLFVYKFESIYVSLYNASAIVTMPKPCLVQRSHCVT